MSLTNSSLACSLLESPCKSTLNLVFVSSNNEHSLFYISATGCTCYCIRYAKIHYQSDIRLIYFEMNLPFLLYFTCYNSYEKTDGKSNQCNFLEIQPACRSDRPFEDGTSGHRFSEDVCCYIYNLDFPFNKLGIIIVGKLWIYLWC